MSNHPPRASEIEAAAGRAAAAGLAIFPVHGVTGRGHCTCGTPDCPHLGKHPRTAHGHRDATTNPDRVRAWWARWPGANIGIACAASGVVVIDIDPRHGGDQTWAALVTAHGPELEATVRVTTGGGGRHYYFRAPAGVRLSDGAHRLGAGVDVKANGYVIMPPSHHASGGRYAWDSQPGGALARHELDGAAPVPPALLALLCPPPAADAALPAARSAGAPPAPPAQSPWPGIYGRSAASPAPPAAGHAPAGDPPPAQSDGGRSPTGARAARPVPPPRQADIDTMALDMSLLLQGVPLGRRNDQLFRLTSKLRGLTSPRELTTKLVLDAAARCRPPFDPIEALAVIDRVYRRYPPGHAGDGGDGESGDGGPASGWEAHAAGGYRSRDAAPAEPPPPFPVAVLPGVARRLVEETAAAIDVPPELVAVPLLTFAGAVIGNQCRVELKAGYVQYPSLFTAVVAVPGAAKTPALAAARAPLDALQQAAREAWSQARAAFEPGRTEGAPAPRIQHYFSTVSTTEALAMMLTTSPGVVLIRDELAGWVASFDAYRGGKGGDRQTWLSLWASQPLKVDRKTSEMIYLPRPVVAVTGGIQPDVLDLLAAEASRRDGFLERILWSMPVTRAAHWNDTTTSEATTAAVTALFRRLRPEGSGGAPADAAVATVRLDAEARQQWAHWYDANARHTEASGGLLQGAYAKLPNQAARLALVLHCLRHPHDPAGFPLSAETLTGAEALTGYFIAHAARVFARLAVIEPARGADGLAGRVQRVVAAAGATGVSRSELHARLGGKVSATALGDALAQLDSAGVMQRGEAPAARNGWIPERWLASPPPGQ